MIDSALFIGAVIIAVTQAIKFVVPQVSGAITVIVAMVVGAITAVLAPHIGIAPISVAQGVLTGLGAVGVHTVANKIG